MWEALNLFNQQQYVEIGMRMVKLVKETYEADNKIFSYCNKFMMDKQISGMGWLKVNKGYRIEDNSIFVNVDLI